MNRISKRAALLALAGAGTFWGLGFVFGKVALAEMPVGAMIAFRFAIASGVLLPVLFFRRGFTIAKGDYVWFLLAGLLYVPVQFILQFEGLARTSVSHASLMVATVPAMLALVAIAATRRLPNAITAVAIGAAVLGAALVAFNVSNGARLSGDLLVLASLLAAVAWIRVTEQRLTGYDAVGATAVMLIAGTIVLVTFELFAHGRDLTATYSLRAWVAVAASGALSTAASTMLWNIGLQAVEAAEAGVFINLEPVIGAACGVVFFGDPLGWQLLAGAAIVLAAATIITLRNTAAEGHLTLAAERLRSYDDGERGETDSPHAKTSVALGSGIPHLRGLRRASFLAARFRPRPDGATVEESRGVHSSAVDAAPE